MWPGVLLRAGPSWVTSEGSLLGTVVVKGGGVRDSLVDLGFALGRCAPPHRLRTLWVVVADHRRRLVRSVALEVACLAFPVVAFVGVPSPCRCRAMMDRLRQIGVV